jgi:limonene-1,2-epoxide hydrolase
MNSAVGRSGRRQFLLTGALGTFAAALPAVVEGQNIGDEERRNIATVNTMCASWKSGDAEAIARFVTEDFRFRGSAERLESPPTNDRQKFVDTIRRFLTTATVEMVVHDTFARGSMVVNIHQQLFEVKGQGPREDWYIGVFHLVGGKIREWNDYAIVPFSSVREPRPSGFGRFVHPA